MKPCVICFEEKDKAEMFCDISYQINNIPEQCTGNLCKLCFAMYFDIVFAKPERKKNVKK